MKYSRFIPHIIFAVLAAVLFCPSAGTVLPWRLLTLAAAIEIIFILRARFDSCPDNRTAAGDIAAILQLTLLAWQLLTARFNLLDKMLFPTPEVVLALFLSELPDMIKGLWSSIILLAGGYSLALLTAIPLGLVIGWRKRLFHAVNPFAKVLGPIPPIVYIPYAIALLPTFRLASIFVIFVGAFWPLFVNTINGVFNIPHGLIDAARVLNLKERTILWKVILPGAMPSICTGANLGLLFAFVLLAAAELIGATSGIGWYVKNFSDFADYQRVVVGILFIGVVVTVITWGTERLERHLLRWRN
ncbi:MAG: ABC transporter permease [Lentisphaerota bacterium]